MSFTRGISMNESQDRFDAREETTAKDLK